MTQEEKWEKAYQLLMNYYNKYGNIRVPRKYIVDGFKLGIWLDHQRRACSGKGTYKISSERINKLNELGIDCGRPIKKQSFDYYYDLLKSYYNQYGNIDVPKKYEIDGVKLGDWLSRIRHLYKVKNGHGLSQEEIDKLNALGINWMIINSYPFEYYYSLLKDYRKEYGDINVPNNYEVNGVKLGCWLGNQREAYKDYLKKVRTVSMIITKEEIDKLNELGMVWSLGCTDWTANYNLLSEYYNKYGNIDIPFDCIIGEVDLDYWLSVQRQLYRDSKLPKARILKLNKYNIDWNEDDTKTLNENIADMEFYNSILNERVNNILNDLIIEKNNKIVSVRKQKQIEKELIKRIWR